MKTTIMSPHIKKKTNSKDHNSQFKISGGTSGMNVCWQVTGIRKDPWAVANRIKVEEEKMSNEKGRYLCPDLYGKPEAKGISNLHFTIEKSKTRKKNAK